MRDMEWMNPVWMICFCGVDTPPHLRGHADRDGYFHWAEAPVPGEVAAMVYKPHNDDYKMFEGKLSPAQIEAQPIVLQWGG